MCLFPHVGREANIIVLQKSSARQRRSRVSHDATGHLHALPPPSASALRIDPNRKYPTPARPHTSKISSHPPERWQGNEPTIQPTPQRLKSPILKPPCAPPPLPSPLIKSTPCSLPLFFGSAHVACRKGQWRARAPYPGFQDKTRNPRSALSSNVGYGGNSISISHARRPWGTIIPTFSEIQETARSTQGSSRVAPQPPRPSKIDVPSRSTNGHNSVDQEQTRKLLGLCAHSYRGLIP